MANYLYIGLCYPACDEKYTGNGPICWSKCDTTYSYSCGEVFCAIDTRECTSKLALLTSTGLTLATSAGVATIVSIIFILLMYILNIILLKKGHSYCWIFCFCWFNWFYFWINIRSCSFTM